MHGMACCAVEDGRVRHVLAIMNENCPDVDKDEQNNVGELLEWEQEWEQVIRYRLQETINRMESMRCERRRHDPLVMRLVKCLVHRWVVESTVDEIDEHIGEQQEEWELDNVVQPERRLVGVVVQLSVTANVEPEAGCRQRCHADHAGHGLLDFQLDLILEKFRMLESTLVEHEPV